MAAPGTGVDLSMYDHRSLSVNSQEEVDLTQTVSLPFLSRGMLPRVAKIGSSHEERNRAGQPCRAPDSAPPSTATDSSSSKSNERTALLPPVPVVKGGSGDRYKK